MSDAIEQAAERLWQARTLHRPCPPIRDLIAADDVDTAYAVQERNTRRRLAEGRRIVGCKIGLTAHSVQRQLGVDQPDFGILFDDMRIAEDETLPFAALMQPRIEAEIAFVLGKGLARTAHRVADVIDATDHAVAALEIVGSRIVGWDIRLADTIADNASSSHFVLGARRASLADLDLVHCRMTLRENGHTVSSGTGEACLGNPLNAVVWLADAMARHGRPLAAGDIVLSGALGPMAAVVPGDVFVAEIDGLGSVSARFGAA